MHRTATLIVLGGVMLLLKIPARAAEPAKPFDPRSAFAETDTNGDGQIDYEEFYARMVDTFFGADTNKDGYLSAEEYGRLPSSQSFNDADANHDGRISLPEFVRERIRQFQAADANHDGALSLDEVLATYDERKK